MNYCHLFAIRNSSPPTTIEFIVVLIVLALSALWLLLQKHDRKQFVSAIKAMAVSGKEEINGQTVEHWLNILNQDTKHTLVWDDSIVLTYKGQDFFFVNGKLTFISQGTNCVSYNTMKSCFLVAVGKSAVRLLSEQKPILRQITGSTELAAFSIYKWTNFVELLKIEKS